MHLGVVGRYYIDGGYCYGGREELLALAEVRIDSSDGSLDGSTNNATDGSHEGSADGSADARTG